MPWLTKTAILYKGLPAGIVKAVFSVFGSDLPVRVVFLLEILEYGVLVFSVFGLCPYLFKRIKI